MPKGNRRTNSIASLTNVFTQLTDTEGATEERLHCLLCTMLHAMYVRVLATAAEAEV